MKTVANDTSLGVLATADWEAVCVLVSSYNKDNQQVTIKLDDVNKKQVFCYELTEKDGFVLRCEHACCGEIQLNCNKDQVFFLYFS